MSKEVKIKITVDGKQVEKSVKDLTKEFNVAEKSVAEINKRLKELREASTQVATGSEEFRELNEEIRRLNLETRQASGALNELGQREPLSNVRKGFEDSAFAISSVNAVLGIANELFQGNEKIQKLITRAQTAFNIVLTATQLIKEKNAIIDGVRNVQLVAYNALLPVATNLTRIFGITTAQAMAAATAGVSLLIAGVVTLVATLVDFGGTQQEAATSTDNLNNALLTQTELTLELARIRGNENEIQQASLANEREKLRLLELQVKPIQDAIDSLERDGVLASQGLLNRRQLVQQQILIVKETIKQLETSKKQTKETQKQRDLQKEIADFIKKNRLELAKSLSQAVSDLDGVIGSFAGSFEQSLSKQLESVNAFPDAIIKSIDVAQEKIKEFEGALKAGGLTNQQRKELVALNNELDRLDETQKAIIPSIKELGKTLSDAIGKQVADDLNKVFIPLENIQNEINKLLGKGALPGFQSALNDVALAVKQVTQFTGALTQQNVKLAEEYKNIQDEISSGKLSDDELVKRYERLNQITKQRINNSKSIEEAQKNINDTVDLAVKVGNNELQVGVKKIENTKALKDNQIAYNNEIIKNIELQIQQIELADNLSEAQKSIINLGKAQIAILKQQNTDIEQQEEGQAQSYSKFTKRFDEINKKSDAFFEKYAGEVQVITTSIQAINDVTAAAFDFRLQLIENERLAMEERYDRELELLNRNADEDVKRVENSLLSEEVKASEIKRLRDQEANDQKIIENRRERERRALERERNRTQQKSAISQAIMGAALAVIQAFAQLGPIAGAIASAGIITTTGLQIATIKRQKFNKGGKVKGPGSDMSDSIPAMLSNGESVINANSTKMFEPLLSKINEIGGGVRFNRGGVAGDTPTMTQSEIVDIEKLARRIGEEMRSNPVKAYVVGNDVSNQQQIDAQIKRRSIV
jgi:hypothetical protein